MKTETLPALLYSNYPLKLAETKESKAYLKILRNEAFRNTYHFFATSLMVNDPLNWDESWFNNYE